jgi:DNA adenine methylase
MVQPSLFEDLNNIFRLPRLSPIIKWAGGKEQELTQILPRIPQYFANYYEPFVGGGAIYFAINRPVMFINDKSIELTNLYRLITKQDPIFFERLEAINHHWRLIETVVENHRNEFILLYRAYSMGTSTKQQTSNAIIEFVVQHAEEFNGILEASFSINIENFIREVQRNLINKITRMEAIEKEKGPLSEKDILDNVESALKSAFYMHFRHLYNTISKYGIGLEFATAIFYFVREFCYASMFRYNSKGEFNVPYGGIQYNRKDFLKKIYSLQSQEYKEHLGKTEIYNLDFEHFFRKTSPAQDDFIFLDPPYDSDFSTYAKNHLRRMTRLGLLTIYAVARPSLC